MVVKLNTLCITFSQDLHRKLSVYKLGNIKNFKMHVRAEQSAQGQIFPSHKALQRLQQSAASGASDTQDFCLKSKSWTPELTMTETACPGTVHQTSYSF